MAEKICAICGDQYKGFGWQHEGGTHCSVCQSKFELYFFWR